MITNETNELNYLFGGYFSAIGKITLQKANGGRINKQSSYNLFVQLYFREIKIAKLFQQNFGGVVKKVNKENFPPHFVKNRPIRSVLWYVNSLNAYDFLVAIEGYVIDSKIKKQIKVAKAYYLYQQTNFHRRLERVRKQKHKYYLQMRGLK